MSVAAAVPSLDRLYADYVNPQWVRLLNLLQMNVPYDRCAGCELFARDGRIVLDFLSGYCVHNAGHNHPAIVEALKEELDRSGPAMLQSHVPELAGQLAQRLCERAGGRLQRVVFSNSGSEAVEAAVKFSRAATGRHGLLCAEGAFHGLTCGALSLTQPSPWAERFGPLLPGIESVPFGSLKDLHQKLSTRKFAAFIVEPIQAEAGIRVPEPSYLKAAEQLCRRYGTLFVLDEVQTGMYRTGEFLAAHSFDLEPDMVVLAKALSGGLIPVGALLMSEAVSNSVYRSLDSAIVHTSTFGENSLAMRAGLATLDVLEQDSLGPRAAVLGLELRRKLSAALAPYEMVRAVRGLGMLSGIEFTAPRQLRLRVAFAAFRRIHPAMFGQILVMRLFRDHGILTQVCGNQYMVLKVAPPLVVSTQQIDRFVSAVQEVVHQVHNSSVFWSDALDLARRTVGSLKS